MTTSNTPSNTDPSFRMVIVVFLSIFIVAGLLIYLVPVVPSPQVNEVTSPPALPGLQPLDVTTMLTENLFSCTGIESRDSYYLWSCEQRSEFFQFRVTLYGQTPETLDYISANAYNIATSEATITQFFEVISALPYDGSVTTQAQTWIEQALTNETRQTTTIGNVPYILEGTSQHRTFTMGHFNWEDAAFFVEIGLERFQQGDIIGAIENCNQALGLDPMSAPAYFLRARAYDEQEDIDRAIRDYTKALEVSDDAALDAQIESRLAVLQQ